MIRTLAAALATTTCLVALASPAAAQTREFNIPAGSLRTALDTFARQSGRQVIYRGDEVRSTRSPGVRGARTSEEALDAILAGTGFKARKDPSGAFAVAKVGNAPVPTDNVASSGGADVADLGQDILVTGTRIRGARPASPLRTITSDDIRKAGQNDLGDVFRALPQNFAGGQNPGVAPGATFGGSANQSSGAGSLNLRGLGPDATLTLVNGERLAYSGIFQATDAVAVPVSAIERVDILLDGASAIYGSDAVAGVANIILKSNFEGLEISSRYGFATSGGYEQQQYSAVAGHRWDRGSLMITGDISRNTPVRASDRDYLSYLTTQAYTIYPSQLQHSFLLNARQDIGPARLSLFSFYTDRTSASLTESTTLLDASQRDETWGVSPGLSLRAFGSWNMRIHGFIGETNSRARSRFITPTTGEILSDDQQSTSNATRSAGLDAEGPIFPLPGGMARLSIGAGYRWNSFETRDLPTSSTLTSGSDHSTSIYGEISLPLIGPELNIPLVSALTVGGALRREHYRTFGNVTTPKLDMIWSVVPGIDLKATWGKSFKAPTLTQRFNSTSLVLFTGNFFAGAPANSNIALLQGGNASLGPERATVWTAGVSLHDKVVPNLKIDAGYFNIAYRDRVVFVFESILQALVNPAVADFVTPMPSASQQEAALAAAQQFLNFGNPDLTPAPYPSSNVYALLDGRYVNAATQRLKGFDVSVDYSIPLNGSALNLNGAFNLITSSRRQLTDLSPSFPTAGVIFYPAKFKARLGVVWSTDAGSFLGAYFNHISSVTNNQVQPAVRGSGMTSVDLAGSIALKVNAGNRLDLGVSVVNALNRRPPITALIAPYYVNYDSTNYSALGRVVNLTARLRF